MVPQPPVLWLTDTEAWRLLGSAQVGRLATVVGGQPDVFPVNFVLDGHSVIFRTAEGSKLLQLIINSAVAFEADDWDASIGWSVVVKGSAHEVTEIADLSRVESLPLTPWVQSVKRHYVRIVPHEISGRRFGFGDEPEVDYTTG